MKLLNVGCGGNRPGDPWINVDQLRGHLQPGTPERINLDKELNYIDHDINLPLPFPNNYFDGVLASHVVEHFDCWGAVRLLTDIRRVLKPDGLVVISVPDAHYFLSVYDKDTRERAVELFGEPISPDEPWHRSFFDYALFHGYHKQVLTRDSMECLILKSGFDAAFMFSGTWHTHAVGVEIDKIMNRRPFSLEMGAVKSSEP